MLHSAHIVCVCDVLSGRRRSHGPSVRSSLSFAEIKRAVFVSLLHQSASLIINLSQFRYVLRIADVVSSWGVVIRRALHHIWTSEMYSELMSRETASYHHLSV